MDFDHIPVPLTTSPKIYFLFPSRPYFTFFFKKQQQNLKSNLCYANTFGYVAIQQRGMPSLLGAILLKETDSLIAQHLPDVCIYLEIELHDNFPSPC